MRGVLWKGQPLRAMTKLQRFSVLNPGIKYLGQASEIARFLYRKPELEIYDRYLKNMQYMHLEPWKSNLANQQMDDRKNQPKKVFPLPRIATDMLSSYITAEESRLTFQVEQEEQQEKIDQFIEDIMLWSAIEEGFGSFFANGSLFIRFFQSANGKIILDPENTKSCWPTFNVDTGELESVMIRWIYDTDEYDHNKKPILRWAQYVCGMYEDVLYNNPKYDPAQTTMPEMKVERTIQHNAGFVQGVWIKNGMENQNTDGQSCLDGALDWLDDFNYMGSKESNSLYYSLFPILLGRGVSKENFDDYMSAVKAIQPNNQGGIFNMLTTSKPPNMADLGFLENSGTGLSLTQAYAQQNIQLMEYILGIYLHDKERTVGYVQSGKAMEFLNKPVVQKVKKMRPFLKKGICDLLDKVAQVSGEVPSGLFEEADKKWGPLFSDTVQDITQRVGYTLQAVQSQIISKKTATKHLAADFGIKNVEEELKDIESEKQMDMEDESLQFEREAQIQSQNQPPAQGPAKKPAPGKANAKTPKKK